MSDGFIAGQQNMADCFSAKTLKKKRKATSKNTIDLMSDSSRWWDVGRDGEMEGRECNVSVRARAEEERAREEEREEDDRHL